MKKKILIADDEIKIRVLMSEFLSDEGFEVVTACDGLEALELFEKTPDFDLCIIDIMMPQVDGYRVCKEIRRKSQVPIIVLTAKTEESAELESFEKGANDYISKPFNLSVLLARVKARLQEEHTPKPETPFIIAHGNLFINLHTHVVELDNVQLDLTPTEYELLTFLGKNKGVVFSREQLMSQIWGGDPIIDRKVDTHVGRLRSKLGAFGEQHIKTVRGYGYKFV